MESDKIFQTRSDDFGPFSGLHFFNSLSEAVDAYKKDKSIWKISWNDKKSGISYRLRPKFNSSVDEWNLLSENKLKQLCPQYENAPDDALFWIDQTTDQGQKYIRKMIKQNLPDDLPDEEMNLLELRMIWEDSTLMSIFNDDGTMK